ncbi:MAG: MaoC family dehydratase [Deltaproteobacteria bacterium]|nr:MaoC family dehydratase [Deltaproteobacteria bacterium]
MEISSQCVGTRLPDYHLEISARQIMNFAAALEDVNPYFFDDKRSEGIVAPPMMAVSLTWQVASRLPEYLEGDVFPPGTFRTQMQYAENLDFHRLIKPGDKITIKSEMTAVFPHRLGSLVVFRFRASDQQKRTVFTNCPVGFLKGVMCIDEGRSLPDVNPNPLAPGLKSVRNKPQWQAPVQISPFAPYIYDGCADMSFPVHTSIAYAHNVGLPNIIVPGTLVLGFSIREILRREADQNPTLLKRVCCRFPRPVEPGTQVVVRVLEKKKENGSQHVSFDVINSDESHVLKNGLIVIKDR